MTARTFFFVVLLVALAAVAAVTLGEPRLMSEPLRNSSTERPQPNGEADG